MCEGNIWPGDYRCFNFYSLALIQGNLLRVFSLAKAFIQIFFCPVV